MTNLLLTIPGTSSEESHVLADHASHKNIFKILFDYMLSRDIYFWEVRAEQKSLHIDL